MSQTFLEKIMEQRREDVAEEKASTGIDEMIRSARDARSGAETNRFRNALSRPNEISIIAEIKRASPSRGIINDKIDVAEQARQYARGGAAAISVLTEPQYFKGSLDDLRTVTQAVGVPILRKDFIVDEFQIYEAAYAGADAILLIVAGLEMEKLVRLRSLTESDLGMDALVEVHSLEEMKIAVDLGAQLIGVNNRDLHSLGVSLDVSRRLIEHKPNGVIMIAESGISTRDEITELRRLGFDGFLVGESLMRSGDAAATLEAWV